MSAMPSIVQLRNAVLAVVIAALVAACGARQDASGSPLPSGEGPTTRIPVIVDTDLDVSDVAALALLVADPGLDVRAVTVAATGTGVTNCASGRRLAGYVLDQLGASGIPFACGREDAGPDAKSFPPEWRTAADSGWGMTVPPRPLTDLPESAADLLARAVDDSPSAPTVVALGPWTNLEDAVLADETFADRIAGIHAMAGAFDVPGNVVVDGVTADDKLEWNVAADPSAVVTVFDTTTPISLVPLDATDDVPVDQALIDQLASDHGAAAADLVYETLVRVPDRIGEGQQLWDELAALAFHAPDLVTWEEADVAATAEGRLARDSAGRPTRFASAADRPAVEAALLAGLRRGDPRPDPFTLSGELRATWDGTTCAVKPFEALGPGVARLTFENTSGTPAGLLIGGVQPPHRWDEVVALLADIDVQTATPPDWLVEAGNINDESGAGAPLTSTMTVLPITYGPICVTGVWPNVTFVPGDPFDVSAAP
jgi:inosine-uridine nucleoside N-ribohydrolase